MILQLVCVALSVYWLILIARIILSWVMMFRGPPAGLSPVMRVIYDLTEPALGLFRRYIPAVGGFDLSPIFVFLIIGVLRSALGCRGGIL